MSDATLWKSVQTWAQNNRIIVGFLALSAVVILLANFTDAVGRLYDTYQRLKGAPGFENRQACLNDASNFREVSKCYRDFP